MNARKGMMLVALALRWIGFLVAAGIVVLGFLINSGLDIYYIVLTFAFAAFPLCAAWIVAWMIEGFAKPKA